MAPTLDPALPPPRPDFRPRNHRRLIAFEDAREVCFLEFWARLGGRSELFEERVEREGRTVICASTRWAGHDDHIAGAEKDRDRLDIAREASDEEYSSIAEAARTGGWTTKRQRVMSVCQSGFKGRVTLTRWRLAATSHTLPSGRRAP